MKLNKMLISIFIVINVSGCSYNTEHYRYIGDPNVVQGE